MRILKVGETAGRGRPVAALLLAARLRWYGVETGRRIFRYWKAIFLAVALLSPLAMPIVEQSRLIGTPVGVLFDPEHSFFWRFAWMAWLEVCAVAWVHVQHDAISGGAFAKYMHALPLAPSLMRRVDLAVLLIADTPLFAPIFATAITLGAESQPFIHGGVLCGLVLAVCAVQVAVLDRDARWLAAVGASDALLAIGAVGHGVGAVGAIGVSLIILGVALASLMPTQRSGAWIWPHQVTTAHVLRRLLPSVPPLVKISAHVMTDTCRTANMTRALLLLGLVAGSVALMSLWGFDQRSVPLALIADAFMAMIVASAYRDLYREHARAAQYSAALPIGRYAQARADVLVVIALCLPFAFVLSSAIAMHRSWDEGARCLSSVIGLIALIAAMRVPSVKAPEHALVLNTLLAGVWVASVWRVAI
ncbi:conserved membrane protein of unknown function [Pararobbsia alpina]|uniref:hypothetical protein n=1 Tax=Pararobbsia alpina TaxID=621374 RepID=UPI0039A4090B